MWATGAMIGTVPPRTTTELVGRHEEVHRILDALGWADGGGGAALLGGDAGIGKTAVVGHLTRLAVDRRTLVGHCVGEGGTSLPYLPFVEMFAALDGRERELVDELVADHPGLVPLVPRVASGAREDAVRADLVEAVHGALADLGRRGPLLVVVEDVHWADESTRDLLTLLFTRGLPDGVALLATYRSDDVHRRHPLAGALAVWSRLPGLTRVDLGPLPDSDLRRVVRRAGSALDDDVVELVAQRAEGNAFFAEELATAAGDRGADPADLARLLLTRVDRLDDTAQSVVRVAAVIGRRVPHALLEQGGRGRRPAPWAVRCGRPSSTTCSSRGGSRATSSATPCSPRRSATTCCPPSASSCTAPASRRCAPTRRWAPRPTSRGTPWPPVTGPRPCRPRCSPVTPPSGWAARPRRSPTTRWRSRWPTSQPGADGGGEPGGADPASGHALTLRAAAAANGSGRTGRAMALLRARLETDLPTDHERAELLGALAFAPG